MISHKEFNVSKEIEFPNKNMYPETIKHPFSHGTFQSHGYGFTSHLFHVVVKNRAK